MINPSPTCTRVVLVDEYPMVRMSLRMMLPPKGAVKEGNRLRESFALQGCPGATAVSHGPGHLLQQPHRFRMDHTRTPAAATGA
jgi:hypothetical protein